MNGKARKLLARLLFSPAKTETTVISSGETTAPAAPNSFMQTYIKNSETTDGTPQLPPISFGSIICLATVVSPHRTSNITPLLPEPVKNIIAA